jgi:hypothetical protein
MRTTERGAIFAPDDGSESLPVIDQSNVLEQE